jgi:FliI/YscN family ATPase
MSVLADQLHTLETAMPLRIVGEVASISGLTIEVRDLPVPVGSMCRIRSFGGKTSLGEVIGLRREQTLLMPLSPLAGVARGDKVEIVASVPRLRCSEELLGRVINGLGQPIDDKGPLHQCRSLRVDAASVAPLLRRNIHQPIATSIRAIDALHTCGQGQRMGIFAGPGVGKSTLLSGIAKNNSADVSVIALIGERGREVKEFLSKSLGPDGMSRCVMVVSTGDEPPPLRVRAARIAATISEYFRDQGKNVLLLMDSLTRLCHAQRQIGLAAGEPPATKGYPPSVFALLPEILERAGNSQVGSITGFYTVLVEGDDFNEPISDAVKGISDGHLWLDRKFVTRGHFPAIDVLQSISRVRSDVATEQQVKSAKRVLQILSTYQGIEDLVKIGAYAPGASLENDLAVQTEKRINQFLQQTPKDAFTIEQAAQQLQELVAWIDLTERTLRAQLAKSMKRPPVAAVAAPVAAPA